MFTVNQQYTKNDIYRILNVPVTRQKGAWDTGYRSWNDSIFIFSNIGVEGRTGHDYDNHWDGANLVWYGKTDTHINQPQIQDMLEGKQDVHIFTREDNYDPFTYQGIGIIEHFDNTTPVRIVWRFNR